MSRLEQVSNGLRKELLAAGSGQKPNKGDTITVNCTGSVNGNPPKKFWRYLLSSYYVIFAFEVASRACKLHFFFISKGQRSEY